VGRSERKLGDLDGAFRARAASPARVLLCDDVFTSGATLDAAAKCLKQAGAAEVWGFTIAKG
jgi:predicted amidophosphoribosyltransferase